MTTVNIYLTFDGNCEAAFGFYKSVFGGDFQFKCHFNEMPSDGVNPISAEDNNRIMHISLPISKETVLMGSDTLNGCGGTADLVVGNNFSISVNTDTKEEADRIFNKLSAGGKITMPLDTTFWGAYFGMLTDQFGIQWMLNVDLGNQP